MSKDVLIPDLWLLMQGTVDDCMEGCFGSVFFSGKVFTSVAEKAGFSQNTLAKGTQETLKNSVLIPVLVAIFVHITGPLFSIVKDPITSSLMRIQKRDSSCHGSVEDCKPNI